jgi:glutaminase
MQIQLVEAIEVQKALHAPQDHEHQKGIKELLKKLFDVKEDLEMQTNMVNALTAKYMTTNHKLQDVKKATTTIRHQCSYL